ncbi:MAG: hypothetical protein ACO1O6_15880 [Bacteroidota bacterium]
MKKHVFLLLFLIYFQSFFGQYFSLQTEINNQYGFGYNAGLNISTDFYVNSDNRFFGPSLHLLEAYVLLERNTTLNPRVYPVAGIGYEYFRKPRKAGKEYATRTGLGLYAGMNFKSFDFGPARCNQLNAELGLTLAGILCTGYGRNLLKSYPDKFEVMNPGYFFLRLTLGVKRTLCTVIDLGGGLV